MPCELKFIRPGLNPVDRYVTCTHPDHTWAMLAPGGGTAKAKVEHGKHLRAVELLATEPHRNDVGMMVSVWPSKPGTGTVALHDEPAPPVVPDLLAALEKSVMDAKAARKAAHPAGGAA